MGIKDYWARRIVNKTYNMIIVNGSTTILIHSDRQSKFLHLQRQCYWDCYYCEKEAMDYLESERGR